MSSDPRHTFHVLRGVTDELSRHTSVARAMQAITDAALSLLPGEHSSIRLLDAPSGVLQPLARSGTGVERRPVVIPAREGIAGWVIANARPTVVRDARHDERFLHVVGRGFAIASMISEPLMWGGTAIGVLSVTSARPDVYSEQDAELLRILAGCAAPRIELKRLERLTVIDELTYAFNATHLMPRMLEELDRARHSSNPLSVLVMDLDGLERVNQAFGRELGDRVMEIFAARIRALSRTYDAFFRWGPDEFVVLLPGTSATQALATAERFRASVGDTVMEPRRSGPLTQTVSISVATWNGTETGEALLLRAAAGLRDSKRSGGNRVAEAVAV